MPEGKGLIKKRGKEGGTPIGKAFEGKKKQIVDNFFEKGIFEGEKGPA